MLHASMACRVITVAAGLTRSTAAGRFGRSLVKNTAQKTTKLYSGVQNTGSPYDPARSDACMGGSWSSCNDSKPF